tara:strand:+ start:347 stop:586 length:240 start_codon:yes stop_codon:yes gene_type:complete
VLITVQDNLLVVVAVEHTTQDQRDQLLLVDLVEQEFQEQDQQQHLLLVMGQLIEVVVVEEMVNLHLLQTLELVDQVWLF